MAATNKRFTMDNPNDWGYPITDNQTGKVYSCASNMRMMDFLEVVNKIEDTLKPIQAVCDKYKIPIKDLPEVLEEYIAYDNEEYLEKLKGQ